MTAARCWQTQPQRDMFCWICMTWRTFRHSSLRTVRNTPSVTIPCPFTKTKKTVVWRWGSPAIFSEMTKKRHPIGRYRDLFHGVEVICQLYGLCPAISDGCCHENCSFLLRFNSSNTWLFYEARCTTKEGVSQLALITKTTSQ